MAQGQPPAHKFINTIGPGETINSVYVVRDPILRSTTRGDLYIAMFLCDRTGQLNGRMWRASEVVYKSLPKPGFVHVQGRSELYQNNLQIVVDTIAAIDPSKVNVEDYLARTTKDCGQMFKEVQEIVGTIKHPQLAALTAAFLADKDLMKGFCSAPGGMKMHHDCIGGLLEHTHGMLRVAKTILPLYPQVQADLVLAGVFLHDMGKTEELAYDMAFSYTDSGQLIGHISKSLLMIYRKADALRSAGHRDQSGGAGRARSHHPRAPRGLRIRLAQAAGHRRGLHGLLPRRPRRQDEPGDLGHQRRTERVQLDRLAEHPADALYRKRIE